MLKRIVGFILILLPVMILLGAPIVISELVRGMSVEEALITALTFLSIGIITTGFLLILVALMVAGVSLIWPDTEERQ